MGVFSAQYPGELHRIVAHARRFSEVLRELERRSTSTWFVGRSGELRAVVSVAIADWRAGVRDAPATGDEIALYMDALHRRAARRLGCAAAFQCCDPDDIVTEIGR